MIDVVRRKPLLVAGGIEAPGVTPVLTARCPILDPNEQAHVFAISPWTLVTFGVICARLDL